METTSVRLPVTRFATVHTATFCCFAVLLRLVYAPTLYSTDSRDTHTVCYLHSTFRGTPKVPICLCSFLCENRLPTSCPPQGALVFEVLLKDGERRAGLETLHGQDAVSQAQRKPNCQGAAATFAQDCLTRAAIFLNHT